MISQNEIEEIAVESPWTTEMVVSLKEAFGYQTKADLEHAVATCANIGLHPLDLIEAAKALKLKPCL